MAYVTNYESLSHQYSALLTTC